MPRFAFATPFLPHKEVAWRATAIQLATRRATEHRAYLLSRATFKERVWMQTGEGSPPLTLTLWDCDDIDRVTAPQSRTPNEHERWMAQHVLADIHGIRPADYRIPTPELLSGTTTKSTATAGTQTMFALPIPEEGLPAVRALVARIENGDLSVAHNTFLTESSIREEWIWLQPALEHCPPLMLIHWIGDDLDHAWQRLTYVRDDEYARVLHQALFTRLIGIPPEQVAQWSVEQLIAMHVRRSDAFDTSQQRLAQRLFTAAAAGRWAVVGRMLDDDVVMSGANGLSFKGRDDVVAALRLSIAQLGPTLQLDDVLAGENHVMGLVSRDGVTHPIMFVADQRRVRAVRLLTPYDS